MLTQRCALEHNRLVIPVSVTRPNFTAGQFEPSFHQTHYRALVDTGAQRSVIARSVIAEQQLARVGHMEFAGIHGPRTHSRYLASIGMWAFRADTRAGALERSEQTLFAIPEPVEVVDMDENRNFDMIAGFDVLKQFSFSFSCLEKAFEICIQP